MEEAKIPTIEQVEEFLADYGWNFRRVEGDTVTEKNVPVVITPYSLGNGKGVLVVFHIEGEFVMASTSGLLSQVPVDKAADLLQINDSIKLVKLFTTDPDLEDHLSADIGFELWNDSWNKKTFFAFMDMLCLGIESTLNEVEARQIPHETDFVTFENQKK
jgi:hypothetical protein